MNFHKRACLERARSRVADDSVEALRYACLELRFCIESICYEKLRLYAKHIPPEVLDTWQPRKVVETLIEYDPMANSSHTLRMWREDQDGNPQELVFSGHYTALSPVVLNKHYNKLGSYLHTPTPAQQSRLRASRPEDLATYLTELISEIEATANSTFDSNLGNVITFDCDECGQPVIRNADSLGEVAIIVCNNPACRAQYSANKGEAGYTVELRSIDFSCEDCGTKNFIRAHLLREGVELTVSCVECESRVVISREWVVRKAVA